MKLLEKVTAVMRRKHYALRTEKTYRHWILAFLRFHRNAQGWRHPSEMGAAEIESFLTHLAVERRVAAATQNQALNAIVFLYKQVLGASAYPARLSMSLPRVPINLPFDRLPSTLLPSTRFACSGSNDNWQGCRSGRLSWWGFLDAFGVHARPRRVKPQAADGSYELSAISY